MVPKALIPACCFMPDGSGMKQQYKTLLDLMKFTFFAAEIKTDLQAFFNGLFEGRGGWLRRVSPEGCDADWGRVPAKPIGHSDVRFTERILQETVDGET